MKPVIGITMGDFNGIGPEIVLKSLKLEKIRSICVPLLIGSIEVYEYFARILRLKIIFRENCTIPTRNTEGVLPVFQIRRFQKPRIKPGHISKEAGEFAGDSIIVASVLAEKKIIDGVVTAPVSKEALHMGGYHYRGQTEMLANYYRTDDTLMLFTAKDLKVGLATTHIPLSRVSREISRKRLLKKISILYSALKKDFAVGKPRIAVLGLNPHAGEGGFIGKEENDCIIPSIRKARSKGINIQGPYPADSFYSSAIIRNYDAILALYHDQGLIPFKMLNFNTGVNVTAGLPIVRTSPDHGTAFEIAGKGTADPTSMAEAIKTAAGIINNRRRQSR